MKKLLILLCATLLFSVALNAQTVRPSLGYNETWFEYNGSAADTIGIGDSTFTYQITKYTTNYVTPRFFVELDSIGGTANTVTVYLQKRISTDESWGNIDTVTYAGTADTSFVLQPDNTQIGDHYRFYMQGSNDEFKVKLKTLNAKFVY